MEEPTNKKFVELLVEYFPTTCCYPEYVNKPYFSIVYEENGERFVGYGTYNPAVLSRYLKTYFIEGG